MFLSPFSFRAHIMRGAVGSGSKLVRERIAFDLRNRELRLAALCTGPRERDNKSGNKIDYHQSSIVVFHRMDSALELIC